MTVLYSTKVTATGGRAGSIKSDDGLLDLKLALPRSMGGTVDATNPEQLFAGGYAACFENAMLLVMRKKNLKFTDNDVVVVAEVGLGPNDKGGFALSVSLNVAITGLDQKSAEEIVEAAHAICPYSNAVRGNIDVSISVATH